LQLSKEVTIDFRRNPECDPIGVDYVEDELVTLLSSKRRLTSIEVILVLSLANYFDSSTPELCSPKLMLAAENLLFPISATEIKSRDGSQGKFGGSGEGCSS
jgi:hypothetical protein